MKLNKIISAYEATEALANVSGLSKDDQWAIFKLRKSLRTHKDFKEEREEKIREKFIPYADSTGTLTGQPYSDYVKEVTELYNMEVDYKPDEETILPLVDGINFKQMEALEDFVTFKK